MCRNREVGTGRRLVGWISTETEVEYQTLSYPICRVAWVKLVFVLLNCCGIGYYGTYHSVARTPVEYPGGMRG